jgi:hypothetical protein
MREACHGQGCCLTRACLLFCVWLTRCLLLPPDPPHDPPMSTYACWLKSVCPARVPPAVREALAIVSEEGLESLWARHLAAHNQLWEGLSSMGLKPFVENEQDRWVGCVGCGGALGGAAVCWHFWACQAGG